MVPGALHLTLGAWHLEAGASRLAPGTKRLGRDTALCAWEIFVKNPQFKMNLKLCEKLT